MLSNLYSFLFIFVFISIIRASCFCFYNSIISFGVVVWFLFAASRLWLVPVIKRPSTLQRYSSIFIYLCFFFLALALMQQPYQHQQSFSIRFYYVEFYVVCHYCLYALDFFPSLFPPNKFIVGMFFVVLFILRRLLSGLRGLRGLQTTEYTLTIGHSYRLLNM